MPNTNNLNNDAENLNKELGKTQELVGIIEDGFRGITDQLQNVVENLQTISDESRVFDSIYKDTARTVKSLSKITEDLVKNEVKIIDQSIKSKDIQEQINRKKAQGLVLDSRITQLQRTLADDLSIRNKLIENGLAGEELENKVIETKQKLQSKINELQFEYNEYIKDGIQGLEEQRNRVKILEKSISDADKKLGLFAAGLKGISKIPFLKDIIDTKTVLTKANEVTRKTGSGIMGMAAGFRELKKQTFEGLLNPVNIALFSFTQLIKAFKRVDAGVGTLAKSFGLSYNNALNLRQELTQVASLSEAIGVTTRGLQESLIAFSDAVGFSVKNFSDLNTNVKEDLILFTQLREIAGFTNEELSKIQKLTLATGGNLKNNVEQFYGTVKVLNAQNKLTVNEKQLLKEVSTVSDAIKLSVGGTMSSLAKAAFQAKQFGINLTQANNIASSLLDFESSITAELEAELLIGKNLNLEKARLLALNGDIAGASAEILSQIKDSAEFTKMNRIQQEVLAKAVGLSREDLAASLIDREALAKIGKGEKTALEAYNRLKKEGLSDEQIAKRLGSDSLAQQLQSQSIQEKFNQAVEKLQDIIGNLVNGPFGLFLEGLASGLDYVGKIFGYFGKIGGLIKGFFGNKIGGFLGDIASVATIGALIALVTRSMLKGTVFNPVIVKDISNSIGGGSFMDTMFGEKVGGRFKKGGGRYPKGARAGGLFKTLGKGAGILSLLSAGVDLSTNLMNKDRSIGNALAKTLDQNKFTALGAGIGALFGGGVGALPGAAIGGLLDMLLGEKTQLVKDAMISPAGGLLVAGPKGTYSLDPNDHIIAGTNLSPSNGPTSQSSTSINYSALADAIVSALSKAPMQVSVRGEVDGKTLINFIENNATNVGTALNKGTSKIQ